MLGRLGILMLGWPYLFWLGVILIVIGATLQTGVTSAVKAVKFSAKLVGNPSAAAEQADGLTTSTVRTPEVSHPRHPLRLPGCATRASRLTYPTSGWPTPRTRWSRSRPSGGDQRVGQPVDASRAASIGAEPVAGGQGGRAV